MTVIGKMRGFLFDALLAGETFERAMERARDEIRKTTMMGSYQAFQVIEDCGYARAIPYPNSTTGRRG